MNIDDLREEIDKCNIELINILKKRQIIAKQIGIIKKAKNIKTYDPLREKVIINKMKSFSDENLSEEMIENIFKEILLASKILQNSL